MPAHLKETLDQDLKHALKEKQKVRTTTIRLTKAAIKNREIEVGHPLEDDEVLQVVTKMAKQRRESIEQFEKGGRQDLADKERQELAILEAYLPQQLSHEELERIVKATIQEVGATSPKEMGKVMSALMPKVQGRADGKEVSALVRANLGA